MILSTKHTVFKQDIGLAVEPRLEDLAVPLKYHR